MQVPKHQSTLATVSMIAGIAGAIPILFFLVLPSVVGILVAGGVAAQSFINGTGGWFASMLILLLLPVLAVLTGHLALRVSNVAGVRSRRATLGVLLGYLFGLPTLLVYGLVGLLRLAH
jgi:hypothetical protein